MLLPRRRTKSQAKTKTAPEARRPGSRGWKARGAGASPYLQAATEWRATTVQVCGLWPFAAGTGSPMIGVPLGRNLISGATLCCDPIAWFQRAKLISNPSVFVLGKPGLGKSTVVRRMLLGLEGNGVIPLVLGDLKPDYVDLIEAMDGQVIRLGRGRGSLNILDPGSAIAAAARLTGAARTEVLADAHGRRASMVASLLSITRAGSLTDREESIIDRALLVLDQRSTAVPVLSDLLDVIVEAPPEVRLVAIDHGSMERYHEVTDSLVASLTALLGGRLGEIFSKPTTVSMHLDRPVVFDLSSIGDGENDLQAAALLACWSYGFGEISVATALADAGLEPRRHYFAVMDELWRALRAGHGMVDRVDYLQRLIRTKGVGAAFISHTMSDLMSLANEEDRMKAKGFVERAGMVLCGGLPAAEMPMLRSAVGVSAAEEEMLVSWQDPPSWDPESGEETDPPGLGNFLVKVGGRSGIPFHVELTSVERDLGVHDTNKLWEHISRIGRVSDLPPVDDEADAVAALVGVL